MVVSKETVPAQTANEVLESAVHEHARLVFRIAYSVLRNHHDAEDAVQETFIRVLRYGAKLTEVHDQRAWLARIAWRVAAERSKKPHRRMPTSSHALEQLRSTTPDAEQALLGSERMVLFERVIANLPRKLRDPLILSALNEMSPADVANVLDTSEMAVRSRIFRARQMLKEKLAAWLETTYAQ